jgi:hypothetical protein
MKILYYQIKTHREANYTNDYIAFAYLDQSSNQLKSAYGDDLGLEDFIKDSGAQNIAKLKSFQNMDLSQVIDIYNQAN